MQQGHKLVQVNLACGRSRETAGFAFEDIAQGADFRFPGYFHAIEVGNKTPLELQAKGERF